MISADEPNEYRASALRTSGVGLSLPA